MNKREVAEQILEDVPSAFYRLELTDTAHKYVEVDREALQGIVREWQADHPQGGLKGLMANSIAETKKGNYDG